MQCVALHWSMRAFEIGTALEGFRNIMFPSCSTEIIFLARTAKWSRGSNCELYKCQRQALTSLAMRPLIDNYVIAHQWPLRLLSRPGSMISLISSLWYFLLRMHVFLSLYMCTCPRRISGFCRRGVANPESVSGRPPIYYFCSCEKSDTAREPNPSAPVSNISDVLRGICAQ